METFSIRTRTHSEFVEITHQRNMIEECCQQVFLAVPVRLLGEFLGSGQELANVLAFGLELGLLGSIELHVFGLVQKMLEKHGEWRCLGLPLKLLDQLTESLEGLAAPRRETGR